MRLIDPIELKRAISVAAMSNNYKTLEQIIDEQPTIEERKTGKWEQDSPFTKPRCSECGEPCFGLHGFDYTWTPYCPNCGARMSE